MFSHDELKALCAPLKDSDVFFRPFVCQGDYIKAKVFLVGINPATQIRQSQALSLDAYTSAVIKYADFQKLYASQRADTNLKKTSRTRIGINAFSEALKAKGVGVLETNVIPYPTSNVKDLRKVINQREEVKTRGGQIFIDLLSRLKPKVIVFHSKEALSEANMLLHSKELITAPFNLHQSQKALEDQSPLAEIKYADGKKTLVFATRHFMYYGKEGKSFQAVRHKILSALS